MKKTRKPSDRRKERLRAIAESAIRARRFTPEETLDIGFELIESGRSLSRAAENAHARRGT